MNSFNITMVAIRIENRINKNVIKILKNESKNVKILGFYTILCLKISIV